MRHVKSAIFALGFAALTPTICSAQPPASEPAKTFSDLRLPSQSFIVVTDQQGRESGGRLIGIDRGTLSIQGRRQVTFSEPEVQLVRRKIPDSVLNGGIIGFVIGMAGPLIVCTSRSDSSETVGCAIGAVGFGGLPGFAIGALIDRARGRMVTMFRAPGRATGRTNP